MYRHGSFGTADPRRTRKFVQSIRDYVRLTFAYLTHLNTDPCPVCPYYWVVSILDEYVTDMRHCANILRTEDSLLEFHSSAWMKYSKCAQLLENCMRYMMRHGVYVEQSSGAKNLHSIYPLALRIWTKTFLQHLQVPLGGQLLVLARRRRDGKYIKASQLQAITGAIVCLGLNGNILKPLLELPNQEAHHICRALLEGELLNRTKTEFGERAKGFGSHDEENKVSNYWRMTNRG